MAIDHDYELKQTGMNAMAFPKYNDVAFIRAFIHGCGFQKMQ